MKIQTAYYTYTHTHTHTYNTYIDIYTYNMYKNVDNNLISKVFDKCKCGIFYNCDINEETYVKLIQGTKLVSFLQLYNALKSCMLSTL